MKKAKEDDPEAYEELRTEFIKKEFIYIIIENVFYKSLNRKLIK